MRLDQKSGARYTSLVHTRDHRQVILIPVQFDVHLTEDFDKDKEVETLILDQR